MGKKNWIYIKRGLSEDPKHRAQMGACIWLYMHIIDRADWETGIAYDWKDEQEAADMSMPVRTLQEQRRKLDELGYITCRQKQYTQDIVIKRWIDPRNYSGNVLNQGSSELEPQGYTQGYTQGSRKDVTPTLDSKSKSSPKTLPPADPTQIHRREMQKLAENLNAYLGTDINLEIQKDWNKWKGVIKRLLEREKQGETVELYARWYHSKSDYDKPKLYQITRDPSVLVESWGSAFVTAPPIKSFLPDDSKAVPAPFPNPLRMKANA